MPRFVCWIADDGPVSGDPLCTYEGETAAEAASSFGRESFGADYDGGARGWWQSKRTRSSPLSRR
jgi:hypothetical protein